MPPDGLDDAVRELTGAILATSPLVTRLGKRAFYELRGCDEVRAYERAVEVMSGNALKHDAQEGIAAFLEKRRPNWTGE